ncbi:uncharacterized protein LOC115717205 [Cannabis sativa]|uniref:uncharacterized protein LOC115717205 n=1 Tax=Cannabis sativa TaxID=3483 RepID=UPI0029C9E270|nr:uncharacterized protein LOC115717205 [Cannabis sativa]
MEEREKGKDGKEERGGRVLGILESKRWVLGSPGTIAARNGQFSVLPRRQAREQREEGSDGFLRQYGFEVPQDDESGEIEANISNDIMGALGLYEASFHGKKGEMNHALEMPQLQWRILDKKLNGLLIEEIYERKQDMNPTLLEFAKLDFNMVTFGSSNTNTGKELLVAVSFGLAAFEAVANRRSSSQMRRWEAYARLYKKVTDEWWCEPGHGDWCTCLEKYTLSRDGMYHKQDQFGRLLPTFLQVIDLTDDEESDYWAVVSDVFDGKQLDYYTSRPSLNAVTWSSMETSINNKVRLLRTMLRWEEQLHTEASFGQDKPRGKSYGSVVLGEVVIVCWPHGEIMRLSTGSTAADAARRVGLEGKLALVNGQLVLPNTKLKDGDVVEFRI